MTCFRRAAAVLVVALALGTSATTAQAQPQGHVWPPIIRSIHHARDMTWHYQRLMGHALRPYGHSAERSHSAEYRMWVLHMWHYHWITAKKHYVHMLHTWYGVPPSHVQIFLCIHSGEGAWNDDTGNGFYGGLQFAQSTWESAGGTKFASRADLATPQQQVAIADNLIYGMGALYSTQWPNTSPPCI